jgi:DNA-directed RNA polymerase V subunit 1
MCGPFSLDFGSDYPHTSSLYILCCKGEALELFSVERQLISSLHGESNLPLGVCSFAILSNTCVP